MSAGDDPLPPGSGSWAVTGPALSRGAFDDVDAAPSVGPRYERVALLGEGGMGRVWLGYDRVLDRQVALKEPLGDPDGPAARLLRREAAVAARLEHPGIVVVHDIVEADGGLTYVMALVRGRPLSEWLSADADRLPLPRLLAALADACTAVGHAHAHGVVHRDLSPRNIMVDDDGTAQVVDWGLAAVASSNSEAGSGSSGSGSMGTPGFTAPEIEAGEPADARADVWSLGAILRRVCATATSAQRLELDAIVESATRPAPADRYPDGAALAADLRRWLDGRPVAAYDAWSWRVVRHTLRAYRTPLAVATIGVLAVIGSLGWGVRTATGEAARAQQAEAVALGLAQAEAAAREQARNLADAERLASADALAARAFDAWQRGDVTTAARLVEQSLARADVPRARGLLGLLGALPRLEKVQAVALPACGQWRISDRWDRTYCTQLSGLFAWQGTEVAWESELDAMTLRYDDDGTVLVRTGPNAIVRVDAETGETLHEDPTPTRFSDPVATYRQRLDSGADPEGRTPGGVCGALPGAMLRTPDAFLLTCADGGVWEVPDGGTPTRWPLWQDAWFRTLLDAGEYGVWAGANDGRVRRIDGERAGFDVGEPVTLLDRIPDSPWMLVHTGTGAVRLFDLRTSAHAFDLPRAGHDVRVTGRREVDVASAARRVRWRLPEVAPLRRFEAPDGVTAVAFSADSGSLAVTDGSGRIHLARIDDSDVRSEPWLRGVAKSVVGRPDGGFFAGGMNVSGVHMFDAETPGPPRPAFGAWGDSLKRVAVVGSGEPLALNFGSGIVLPAADGTSWTVVARDSEFADLANSPGSRHAIAVGPRVLVFAPDRSWRELETDHDAWYAGAISDDGEVALLARGFIDLLAPDGTRTLRIDDVPLSLDLSFVPGRTAIAVGGRDGALRVYDTATGALVSEAPVHAERVATVTASRDGRWIASGAWDGAVHLHAVAEIFAGAPRRSAIIAPLLPAE